MRWIDPEEPPPDLRLIRGWVLLYIVATLAGLAGFGRDRADSREARSVPPRPAAEEPQ